VSRWRKWLEIMPPSADLYQAGDDLSSSTYFVHTPFRRSSLVFMIFIPSFYPLSSQVSMTSGATHPHSQASARYKKHDTCKTRPFTLDIVVLGREKNEVRSVHGCEGDVGRVDRKIDAEWEVRRRALGFDWAPSDVSGIPVTKRNRRFCIAMLVSELLCPPPSMCQKSEGRWGADDISFRSA
jgi:hypothetical protein